MDPEQIYQRRPAFEENVKDLRLRKSIWDLAFAFDGIRSLAEVRQCSGLDEPAFERAMRALLQLNLIEERLLTLSEYQESSALKSNAAAFTSKSDEPALITARIGRNGGRPRRMVQADSPRFDTASVQLQSPEAPKPFRLKPAIDFIVVQSGGGTLGQLAVYRVFMRVPTDLMKRANIHSLSLVDETVEITDPELQQAIMRAINQTMGVELPIDYFVAA